MHTGIVRVQAFLIIGAHAMTCMNDNAELQFINDFKFVLSSILRNVRAALSLFAL